MQGRVYGIWQGVPRMDDDPKKEEAFKDDPKTDDVDVLHQLGHFSLRGEVTRESSIAVGESMLRFALSYRKAHPRKSELPELTLYIASNGGSVPDGLSLGADIERVRSLGFPVRTHITFHAWSMGIMLAQFGSVRSANPRANILVHDVRYFSGYGRPQEHREDVERYELMRRQLVEMLAARNSAGHTDPEWWLANYFDHRDYTLTAPQALELGLLDELCA